MRPARLLSVGLGLLVLATCSGDPGRVAGSGPRVEATVEPQRATIGDLLRYRLVVDRPTDTAVSIAELEELAGLPVGAYGTVERRGGWGRRIEEHWYELRADHLGRLTFVGPTVSWTSGDEEAASPGEARRISPEDLVVEVASVLPEGATELEPRDLKPLEPPRSFLPWPVALALIGTLVALAIWLRRWLRRRDEVATPVPSRPADEIALESLEALGPVTSLSPAQLRHFLFAVSAILREYVEARLGLNATDLTTREIIDRLDELGLAGEQRSLLTAWLNSTETLRFGARDPEAADGDGARSSARRFVMATRPIQVESEAA